MEYLKVSAKSSPASIAGAIAGMVGDGTAVSLQAIGAGAVNQGIKAIAIARGFLVPTGVDITVAPLFSKVEIYGEMRTAIRLNVYVHEISLQERTQTLEQIDQIEVPFVETQTGIEENAQDGPKKLQESA